MLLPLQGANPNIHRPRALPWAGCLLAFQAVTSQKLYRTPIISYIGSIAISLPKNIHTLFSRMWIYYLQACCYFFTTFVLPMM